MLDSATIETIDRYWMSDLGCSQDALYSRQTLIVPHSTSLSDYHGIFVFLHDELLLISVPRSLIEVFRRNAEGWSRSAILQEDRLRALVNYPIEQVIGPAFVGYNNRANFRPAPAAGAHVLGQQDITALEDLRGACSDLEWEHGGSQLGDRPVVGQHSGDQLVAVAGYQLWGGEIAHIYVITHPQYRGKGYGKSVVSRITDEVLNQGLVPQYRTLEENLSSIGITRSLGFERYATTVAVRLRPGST
jgi:GNAT superfamily N-acetyltransferase